MLIGENRHLADNTTLNEHHKATSEASTRELPIFSNHTLVHHHHPPPIADHLLCPDSFQPRPLHLTFIDRPSVAHRLYNPRHDAPHHRQRPAATGNQRHPTHPPLPLALRQGVLDLPSAPSAAISSPQDIATVHVRLPRHNQQQREDRLREQSPADVQRSLLRRQVRLVRDAPGHPRPNRQVRTARLSSRKTCFIRAASSLCPHVCVGAALFTPSYISAGDIISNPNSLRSLSATSGGASLS